MTPVSDPFRAALSAIDDGDVDALGALLDAHPELAIKRLDETPEWLRQEVGGAADGFFNQPYLLWFVAEDPVRKGRVPPKVAEIIRTIAKAAKRGTAPTLQEQLDTTLRLVCWSGVAAQCGRQLEMIDALLDAGAVAAKNQNNALVNGHLAAARHLLARGATPTLASAVCLDRWKEATNLVRDATPAQRQFALVLAALNGRAAGVKWMLEHGAAVNLPSDDLYSHGTPLHHAVCSGSLETVQVLVEAGADLSRPDTAWDGTPLGWAEHYVENATPDRKSTYDRIASYLRSRL
jgi:peptide-methionine (S)-S-oxide reductase